MFDTTQDRMDEATAADVRASSLNEGDVMLCHFGASDRPVELVRILSVDSDPKAQVWVVSVDKPDGDFMVDRAALIKNDTTFVAIGPFAWGRSTKSIDEAVRIMKTQVPRSYLSKGKHRFPVYKVSGEFMGVNGMGSIEYRGRIEQVHEGFIIGR